VLLVEDPNDTRFVRGMGIIHRRLGEVQMMQRQYARALGEYNQSLEFYERFFAGKTGPINDRRDYANAQAERAAIATAMRADVLARRSMEAAAASLDSIAKRGTLTRSDSALLLRVRPPTR
jgi:hypothetical protein